MFQFAKAFLESDAFDFSALAKDLTQPGALSLDQVVSNPRNDPAVQDEIDYYGRDSQAETDYLSRDSQAETDYLNRDAQAEIDYYNQMNQTGASGSDGLWF
ncbi:MAG TPA: hypothetical protein VIL65_14945 [Beijerinckiaceae bacterium]|jgi:hypothetical protein